MLRWMYAVSALAAGFGAAVCIERRDLRLAALFMVIAVSQALLAWKIPEE